MTASRESGALSFYRYDKKNTFRQTGIKLHKEQHLLTVLPGEQFSRSWHHIPKSDTALPALVVELKWEENVDNAIDQIKRNDYPAVLP